MKSHDYSSPGAYFITICTHQRQCLFGEIVEDEVRLNELGQMVHACWQRLPFHFPNLELDAFVIMPNHLHGILVLNDSSGRGAALEHNLENNTENSAPNATPNPQNNSEPGVAFEQGQSDSAKDNLPNAAPLRSRLASGSVGAMVLNFKSVTTRSRNRIQRSPRTPMWQRNYYEHIIRNDESREYIRQYIQYNPISWQQDQLHPDKPSKW